MTGIGCRSRYVAIVAVVAFAASACGGAAGEKDATAESASPEPDPQILTVVIADQGDLEVYFNFDDTSCTATSFRDALDGTTTPTPEIVVRDGSGEVLASTTAPRTGGTFSRSSGCRVDVDVEVPAAEFYEVTVTAGSDAIERSATVEAGTDLQAVVRF